MTRQIVPSYLPRRRLDAGTFAAMGPALGYAIAAQVVFGPTTPIVAVLGDSSFGFSAIEVETAARYRLPLVLIIINNNGIYSGVQRADGPPRSAASSVASASALDLLPKTVAVTALSPGTRYDAVAVALGAHARASGTVHDPVVLAAALPRALEAAARDRLPVVLNVLIAPRAVASEGGPMQQLRQEAEEAAALQSSAAFFSRPFASSSPAPSPASSASFSSASSSSSSSSSPSAATTPAKL